MRSRRRVLLHDSIVLIGERAIGQMFGWDLVDWPAVERQRGRRFSFRRDRRLDPAIYDQLRPLLDRCKPVAGDFAALGPSTTVNANLSRLIGYLCRHFGEHHVAAEDSAADPLQRTVEQERLHVGVVGHILGRIEDDPALGVRASTLKRIAGAAEGELEKHFAALINARIEATFLRRGAPDRRRRRDLDDQARAGVEDSRALNRRQLAGLSMPNLPRDRDRERRLEMAKRLLDRFPYTRNYELMMVAELAMLQQPPTPRFLRERLVGDGGIDAAVIRRLDRAVDGLADAIGIPAADGWSGSLSGKVIAFCGSGSLPLSGLFLHLMTGARIRLIDHDQAAIEHSARLISNLERLEILLPGALSLVHRDAAGTDFRGMSAPSSVSPGASIVCDAVMIASLVDPHAKAEIARKIGGRLTTPDLLVSRSARALSARLAYDPIDSERFGAFGLAYCGEAVPATHVATHLDRLDAIRQGLTGRLSQDLLATAHPSVVNSTELYRRMPVNGAAQRLDAAIGAPVEQWLRRLEQAQRALRAVEAGD